jgi:hypothetical protein
MRLRSVGFRQKGGCVAASYLLDSDHCIAFLNPRNAHHSVVHARINSIEPSRLRIAIFTAMELAEGPFHGRTSQEQYSMRTANAAFRRGVSTIGLNEVIIQEFGHIPRQSAAARPDHLGYGYWHCRHRTGASSDIGDAQYQGLQPHPGTTARRLVRLSWWYSPSGQRCNYAGDLGYRGGAAC